MNSVSEGWFWQAKKAQRRAREAGEALIQARRLILEAMGLLGLEIPKANLISVVPTKPKPPPRPFVAGYMNCERCEKHRRCYLLEEQKICITCRRKAGDLKPESPV